MRHFTETKCFISGCSISMPYFGNIATIKTKQKTKYLIKVKNNNYLLVRGLKPQTEIQETI